MLLERCDTEPFTRDTFWVRCYNTKPKPHLTTSATMTVPVFGKRVVEVSGQMGLCSVRER